MLVLPIGDRVGSFRGENVTGAVTNHDGARAIVIARHSNDIDG
jgi:hypothetical protein